MLSESELHTLAQISGVSKTAPLGESINSIYGVHKEMHYFLFSLGCVSFISLPWEIKVTQRKRLHIVAFESSVPTAPRRFPTNEEQILEEHS